MNHVSALSHHSDATAHEHATGFLDLLTAFIAMSHGITRPKSVQRKLEDAARGRLKKPLGSYPEVANAVIDAGGSEYFVSHPLRVMLAHIRRRARGKLPQSLREALCLAKKEEAEAAVPEMNLALCIENPDLSVLHDFIRETREEIAAEEHAVEIAEEILYGGGK